MIDEKLIEIINGYMQQELLSSENRDIPFDEMGIDSFDLVMIIVRIEDELSISFPDNKIVYSELNSLDKLVSVVEKI